MKIAFFSKHLPSSAANGVSIQVHRLANALVDAGHTVTCFTLSPTPADARYLVKTLSVEAARPWPGKLTPALKFRSVDCREFDIVHYHGDDYLCKGTSRRVRTFYGSALSEALHAGRPLRFFYQALFYGFEWVSCLRKGTLVGISAATCRDLPLVRRHIPCGVPLDRYLPGAAKTRHPSILFMGDLRGRKRGALLISVFERLIRPAIPECTLSVIGPTPVAGSGLVYLGRVGEPQLIEELQQCWVLCIPSSYEGFGVPAIEAMACGTAVVGTRCAGLQEVIVHGDNGLLCPAGALGPTLIEVLTDTQLRGRMVSAGLSAAKRYSLHLMAEAYDAIYQSLMPKHHRQ